MIIQQLKLSSEVIFLEGISLRGDFSLMNPNKMIAISYFIDIIDQEMQPVTESPESQSALSAKFSIFPKSGLLLKGQSQKITIRAKNHEDFENESQIDSSIKVCLKCSLNNNFNKILIKNKKVADLNEQKLISYEKILTVHIEIGTDHLRLKNDIENEVLLGSSLGKETAKISMIESNVKQKQEDCEDCDEVCTIVNSLQINSRLKSGISKEQSFVLHQKLEQEREQINIKLEPPTFKKLGNESLKMSLQSAEDVAFSQSFVDCTPTPRTGRMEIKVNSLELILLAILAGFFYSLGSNIRQLQG